MDRISQLVSSISSKFKSKKYDKFIHEITFPKFKSFAPNVRIDINFPVTLFVGPNGGGKSSILHAAWGMPLKFSTSRFWFSTSVDPIDFDNSNQNRYWYKHYIASINQMAQCRKMCGNKRHGYWEPTRPAQKEGMDEMPARNSANEKYMSPSGDRWTQVERTPYYINSKAESNAFDRFFYSADHASLEARQDHFVRYSRQLKIAAESNLLKLEYYGVQRIKENYEIPAEQLKNINNILGKNYISARYINHSLYDRNFAPSVIFETSRRKYSESFAGSGELAVVNYVIALEKVNEFDLVLLDEPETSLHPGAQKKLMEYILGVVDKKLIQVFISTHSREFVDLLPLEALVVLEESDEGISVRPEPTKTSAFYRLGSLEKDKLTILTEDHLLKVIAEEALKLLDPEVRSSVSVVAAEVGASEMLSNQVRAYAQTGGNVLMVLDGDQSKLREVIGVNISEISDSKESELLDILKSSNVAVVGSNFSLSEWISWCQKRVIFIDEVCPEQVLLELLEPGHSLLTDPSATNKKFKQAVKSNFSKKGLDKGSIAQQTIFKYLLAQSENRPISVDKLAEKLSGEIPLLLG